MGSRRMGHRRIKKAAKIGDLVICVDFAKRSFLNKPKKFVGLVVDKSITVYKIQTVNSAEIKYWPEKATYLWKETK